MTRPKLLLAAAAAALAAAPLAARPMTATDMHMMHRLGAPEVSPDGKWAVFTISDTDLDKNKRNNTLYLLDLTKPGAAPQPIAAAAKGHDAVFGPDGALWFLMAADGRDQLFRMPIGRSGSAGQRFSGRCRRIQAVAGGRSRRRLGRPARLLGYRLLDCAVSGEAGGLQGAPTTNCSFATGIRGPSRESRSRLFAFPIQKRTSDRRRGPSDRPDLRATRRPSRSAAARSYASRPTARRSISRCARPGGLEPMSTNLDIFAMPSDGSAPPVNLTDANDATDNLPAVSPDGRTLAYFAMARPAYEADRQVLMLRDLASGHGAAR